MPSTVLSKRSLGLKLFRRSCYKGAKVCTHAHEWRDLTHVAHTRFTPVITHTDTRTGRGSSAGGEGGRPEAWRPAQARAPARPPRTFTRLPSAAPGREARCGRWGRDGHAGCPWPLGERTSLLSHRTGTRRAHSAEPEAKRPHRGRLLKPPRTSMSTRRGLAPDPRPRGQAAGSGGHLGLPAAGLRGPHDSRSTGRVTSRRHDCVGWGQSGSQQRGWPREGKS